MSIDFKTILLCAIFGFGLFHKVMKEDKVSKVDSAKIAEQMASGVQQTSAKLGVIIIKSNNQVIVEPLEEQLTLEQTSQIFVNKQIRSAVYFDKTFNSFDIFPIKNQEAIRGSLNRLNQIMGEKVKLEFGSI